MRPSIFACGNLTKTPQLETTQKGTPVARFTVACNAGKDEDATFLWCVAYNKAAETIAKYFEKGQPILVAGLLRSYKDAKGAEHFVCDVRDFGFAGSARQKTEPPPPDEKRDAARTETPKDAEDEPF